MSVVAKIAFRNVLRHKTKTLIIGSLVAVGMVVIVLGNSLLETAERGIEQTYVRSYTGHLVITARHSATITLMGVQGMDAADTFIPAIPRFEEVLAYVSGHPAVEAVNPQAVAMVLVDYEGRRSLTQAFGIDPVYYERMFPDNIEIVAGRMLAPGEEGILLNERGVKARLERSGEVKVVPGSSVLLTGMSATSGVRVREVPIRGIFRFRHGNPALDVVSLVDITNMRALAGLNVAAVSEAELSELEAALLGAVDEEALFGGDLDSLFGGLFVELAEPGGAEFAEPGQDGEEVLWSALSLGVEEDDQTWSAAASSAWHFLLVRLKEGASPEAVAAELQRHFDAEGIDVEVSDWLSGAGAVALLATGTKLVFNVVVLVIAVVAVFVITNTLVISVTERTTEIGTMRALGAQKSFVRRMIFWETLMTTGLFGLAGVVLGLLALAVLNWTGIEAPNVFFEILFGGKVLHPRPSWSAIAGALALVLAIGAAASVYPVSIAMRTEPAKAMQE